MGRRAGSTNCNAKWIAFFEELIAIPAVPAELIERGMRLAKVKLPKRGETMERFARATAELMMSMPEGQRDIPSTEKISKAWKRGARGKSWIDHNRREAHSLIIREAVEIKLDRQDVSQAKAIVRAGGTVGRMHGPPTKLKEIPCEEAELLAARVRRVRRGLDRAASRKGKSRAVWGPRRRADKKP